MQPFLGLCEHLRITLKSGPDVGENNMGRALNEEERQQEELASWPGKPGRPTVMALNFLVGSIIDRLLHACACVYMAYLATNAARVPMLARVPRGCWHV